MARKPVDIEIANVNKISDVNNMLIILNPSQLLVLSETNHNE
jgi:hypothetical protein